jgi:CubicO group peptidase (beta-lactamase class C family)
LQLNDKIQPLLEELVDTGQEIGLQVAAYVDGELVLDTWAGVADRGTGRLVDGETLFTSWSTTKGFVATGAHILAERGLIDYDTPIAHYWPEFAAHGKGGATVRHALIHAAGVPQLPPQTTPELICDWDGMCPAIADLEPLWAPGTRVGYHAWTFGWIVGEVVRRASGRTLAQVLRDELCRPLGIESFFLGIPDEVESRVAPLSEDPPAERSPLGKLAMPPQFTNAATVNRPDVRRASVPGAGGIMNARAIARHYAMLAGGGELDGARVLSAERVALASALQTEQMDVVQDAPKRKALGYMLGGPDALGGTPAMGESITAFGHNGHGGSLGFADPQRRLGFGLTKNLLRAGLKWNETAAYQVSEMIRSYLDSSPSA